MNVLIITGDKCDDSELLYPYFRLLEEDANIVIASTQDGVVNAKYHFSIPVDCTVDTVDTKEFDALLLPGGQAPEKLRQNKYVVEIIKSFFEDNKPIAGICHGQQTMISAGILNGKNATCYPGIKDDLLNAGAIYYDEKVVVDYPLVTSRRPEDLPYFMREFITLLKK